MLKYKIVVAVLLTFGFTSVAQLETNSTFSRFGLGNIVRPVNAFNASMGGVATSLTSQDDINTLNPALLYRTKKVTFEVGGSYNFTNVTQGQASNTSSEFKFDYLNLAFPITPRYTFALGLKPFSDVNYRTESVSDLDNSTSVENSYFGEGGISAVNFANSYTVLNDSVNHSVLSLGLDASLLVGSITRNATSLTVTDGVEAFDVSNYRNISSYSGFRFKAGASYRKELFNGKSEKIVDACDTISIKDTVLVNSLFYTDEIDRVSENAYITDYAIIFPGSNGLKISKKIKSEARREQLINYYSSLIKRGYGVLVLTDAEGVDYSVLKTSYSEAIEEIKKGGKSSGVLALKKMTKEYLRLESGIHLTAGLAYEVGSDINISETTEVSSTSTLTGNLVGNSTLEMFDDEKVRLPQTIHFGLSIDKDKAIGRNYCGEKLKATWALGTDLSITNWSEYSGFNVTETFDNTYRIGVGGYYTPFKTVSVNDNNVGLARLLLKTNYRAGVYFQTLPYSISGEQVSEIGTNIGFTFPTSRGGSSMTWTLGYSRRGAEIEESYFNVGLGLTLVDRSSWFKSYQVGL